ncbi:four-carbon acid sugar kinase family protein [candidate division KSB3 bacterium]|uniref:Four-carbon acid sugar kinase family protein n=1 Tax=candidate division KSB3 bacterium TaxID=2044937 RepID=A0A9D5Q6Y1_9BACT|nr:four-carbon acid sugar kinase family protein [candidate division KSB3 bacterium]MBD3325351.1 four-carbon acid sugar kinase family protein [candidate division KSB3 bacterium]
MPRPLRIVVLDDDPTGIQTIHGCLLVTQWDQQALRTAFADACPFFYIFTNTRAHHPDQVREIITEAVQNVIQVNQTVGDQLLFISRSDSTLRSHFPLEITTIMQVVERESGTPIDLVFLVPAFFEAGRVTRNDTHYLREGDRDIPTSDTEFAKDAVFGYTSSHLPTYIEEKTGGQVQAQDVRSISLEALRAQDSTSIYKTLNNVPTSTFVVVNAETYADLDRFAEVVHRLIADGKQVLFQSAASVVKALTHTPDKPLLGREIVSEASDGSGLFIIGSHVRKTSLQLNHLVTSSGIHPIEIDVAAVLTSPIEQLQAVSQQIRSASQSGHTPAVYTSREELRFQTTAERLQAGQQISQFLADLVAQLPVRPAYLVAKGGITSHDVLVKGLQVSSARVLGQILPGVPVIALPAGHRLGAIPYIIFPGNVGDEAALAAIFQKLGRP